MIVDRLPERVRGFMHHLPKLREAFEALLAVCCQRRSQLVPRGRLGRTALPTMTSSSIGWGDMRREAVIERCESACQQICHYG
mmetsp:Transcript_5917/g.15026  ORF Transcript_5917/g.15026 Transcript_5917/m.15026 type:complete len:83 (+) Transcript_5917:68-316(+)